MQREIEPSEKPPKSNDFSIQSLDEYSTELRYSWSSLPEKVESKNSEARDDVQPNNKKKKDR